MNAARNNLGIVALGKDYPKLEKIEDELIEVLPEIEGPSVDTYYSYSPQMKDVASVVEFGNYLKGLFSHEEEDSNKNKK